MSWEDKFRKCTPEQRKYVHARLAVNSDAKAAKQIGVTVATVNNWPQFVHDVIREALEVGFEDDLKLLRVALPKAIGVKIAGLDSKNERVRQATASELLERFYGKPMQNLNANVTANVALKGYVSISPDDWDTDIDSALSAIAVAGAAVERQEPDLTLDGQCGGREESTGG